MSVEQSQCRAAIEYVSNKISTRFTQYPQCAQKFKSHCIEEAFEEIDVLIDDFGEGFDESVILEAITEEIDIHDDDKESLCKSVHHWLSIFVSLPPEPISLHLKEIETKLSEQDINSMKQTVSSQVKLLKADNEDPSILKVLIIGQKNNFPLLSYSVDSYHRYRLSKYIGYVNKRKHDRFERHYHKKDGMLKQQRKKEFRDVTLTDFRQKCDEYDELYQKAIKACIHRHGLFYLLPLKESLITHKIDDSLEIFAMYTISVLKCVNKMLQDLLIKFPIQIDVWIIPKIVKLNEDDAEDPIEIDEQEIHLNEPLLKFAYNLQTIDITKVDINKLCNIFRDVIIAVIKQQTHKRMVMIIDRRGIQPVNDSTDQQQSSEEHKEHIVKDKLYAYLPKHTANIPKGDYLHESMINLSKLEILPGEMNGNTINADSDILNMFLLSLHVDNEDGIGMYWHFTGSCTRFFVNDIYNIWPSYFVIDPNIDENSYNAYISRITNLVETHISDKAFDQLIDGNFIEFYEINTGNDFSTTLRKPKVIKPIKKQFKGLSHIKPTYSKWEMRLSSKNVLKQPKLAHTFSSIESEFIDNDIKIEDDTISYDIESCLIQMATDEVIDFIYKYDMDKNGLLYFLGSLSNTTNYTNPGVSDMVTVNVSSLAIDSESMSFCVGRECKRCMTKNEQPSWISIDLKDVKIKISHYTIRHYNSFNSALRDWSFEGSNDNNVWFVLSEHILDESLEKPGDTATFEINTNYYFSYFRIYMNGTNNNGRWNLAISGLEFYGLAFDGFVSESLKQPLSDDEDLENNTYKEFKVDINHKDNLMVTKPKWTKSTSVGYMSPNKLKPVKMRKIKSTNNKMDDDDDKEIHVNDIKLKTSKTWSPINKLISPKTPKKNWKWNVYHKMYKKCIQNKGMVIKRVCGEFNKEYENENKFMFGCSNGVNHGINEIKIKYESISNQYCQDAVGITTNINQCKNTNQWITDDEIDGIKYIYWNAKIYCIENNEYKEKIKEIKQIAHKWKNGEILTIRMDLSTDEWFIEFFIHNKQIGNTIKIKIINRFFTKYYPIISTQSDDATYTIIP